MSVEFDVSRLITKLRKNMVESPLTRTFTPQPTQYLLKVASSLRSGVPMAPRASCECCEVGVSIMIPQQG
ncbi:hypothetical protein C8Q80DRAFT_1209736, partial [Daedaleopsis nitida]